MAEKPTTESKEPRKNGAAITPLIIIIAILLFSVYITVDGSIKKKGHLSVRQAIIEYMQDHKMEQPESWVDLEPYRPYSPFDPGGHLAKKHFAINWDVDYQEICRREIANDPFLAMRTGKQRSILYYRNKPPEPDVEWVLPPQLDKVIKAHLDAKEANSVNVSRKESP